ncbi:hypothetical protein ABB10_07735 [Bacillus thuringiensis]|nr:hypothetical protein [Bacillus thuringiensis]MBH0352135.1 hypothetical protein [Bacillus thuringiensis]
MAALSVLTDYFLLRFLSIQRVLVGFLVMLLGSGAKNRNDLKVFFQTRLYWYYYLKKVCDQYRTRKYIQMETLPARYYFANSTLVPTVQLKPS